MTLPSHSSRFYHPNTSLSSFLQFPLTSSLLGPNILSTLLSNTLSLRSSLSVSDQVSHPCKIALPLKKKMTFQGKSLRGESVDVEIVVTMDAVRQIWRLRLV
jgi:hypothetical protein